MLELLNIKIDEIAKIVKNQQKKVNLIHFFNYIYF